MSSIVTEMIPNHPEFRETSPAFRALRDVGHLHLVTLF